MKVFVFAGLILGMCSLASADYYDDNEKVRELADSGVVHLTVDSPFCPKSWNNPEFTDLLGEPVEFGRICVKKLALPEAVESEISAMKEEELTNESDYDARLTRLYVLKQEDFGASINSRQLKKLAEVLGIPKSQLSDVRMSAFIGDSSSLSHFAGIVIDDVYVEESQTLSYLRSLIIGKLVFRIEIEDGIDLYPGGGFFVTHEILIVDGLLIYVKRSWWDA